MSKKIEEICRRSILRLYPRMSNNSVDFIINVFKRYGLIEKKDNSFRVKLDEFSLMYLVTSLSTVINSIEESMRLGKAHTTPEMIAIVKKILQENDVN